MTLLSDHPFESIRLHLIQREVKIHLLSEVDEVVSLVYKEQLECRPSQVVAP